MTITAIKAQVKNAERVSIYVDQKYAFSLGYQDLLDQKLRVGLELDEAWLAELKKLSDFGKAYGRVLNYIMIRPRSRKEIEEYCWRKKYDPADCQVIIAKLEKRGYINDRSFARAWVESRRLTKNFSQRRLTLELRHKGVSDDIVHEVLRESEFDEQDSLQALVTKKRKSSRYQDPQKLMQYLARQGFSFDDIKAALQESE